MKCLVGLAVFLTVALLCAPANSARTQSSTLASPSLKFEVATIKPSQPGGDAYGIRPAPGGERYLATNIPLKLMMMTAYRVKGSQITGGPSWIDNDRFDMNAKAERPSSIDELHVMLQNLLADQFKLQFHHEKKELPVYVLAVDEGGPKVRAHDAQNAGEPWIDIDAKALQMAMHAKFVPMDYFVWRLAQLLDRPVVDQTNLKGGYDFDLSFTRELPPGMPENAMLNGQPIDTSGPTIYEAIRKQLGLKLDRQKAPVDILVIDHAEKPMAN